MDTGHDDARQDIRREVPGAQAGYPPQQHEAAHRARASQRTELETLRALADLDTRTAGRHPTRAERRLRRRYVSQLPVIEE